MDYINIYKAGCYSSNFSGSASKWHSACSPPRLVFEHRGNRFLIPSTPGDALAWSLNQPTLTRERFGSTCRHG
jgi:hypothetical protein